MGAAYTAIKFEGPGHPTWQLAVYNNILLETIFFSTFSNIVSQKLYFYHYKSVFSAFSENKLVAWVVLVAGFVQQTFFPTTKINYFCFIFNLLAPGSDPKFSKERTRSNLTRLGLNPIKSH